MNKSGSKWKRYKARCKRAACVAPTTLLDGLENRLAVLQPCTVQLDPRLAAAVGERCADALQIGQLPLAQPSRIMAKAAIQVPPPIVARNQNQPAADGVSRRQAGWK